MILITGGTGSNGFELIKILSGRGVPVRAMVRNPEKATSLKLPGVELVQGDFSDSVAVKSALQGIDRAFLLAPAVENLDTIERDFIDLAKSSGVRHIINLSAVGAGIDVPHRFGIWHGKTEQYLKQSGLDFTILRPNFFMQNLIGFAGMIKGSAIYVPAGTGKAPFVDVRDIAATSAAVLTESGHEGKIYDVTGPAAIGYAEIAATFARVLGHAVNYVDVPVEAAEKSMVEGGMPLWFAQAINELNTQMSLNRFSTVSDTVEKVAKKTPISIEQFVRDYISQFRP